MKKKLLSKLFLLLAILGGANSAWADETLLTFTVPNPTDETITVTAKEALPAGNGTVTPGNAWTTGKDKDKGWKLDGDGSSSKATSKYALATLASGVTFQAGDIITIFGYTATTPKETAPQGYTLCTDAKNTQVAHSIVTTGDKDPIVCTHTIATGSTLIGKNEVYILRYYPSGASKGSSAYLTGITITRSGADSSAPTFSLTTPSATSNVAISSRSVVLTASKNISLVSGVTNPSGTLKVGDAAATAITYSFDATAKTLTYTFDADLNYETTYAFTVDADQVQDDSDNKNAASSIFTFTTVDDLILAAESTRIWDFTSSTDFIDATSADKTYGKDTKVNNLLIGNGATLKKADGTKSQRLMLNNQGTASGYYVKIKVASHRQITVSAVGGSGRDITFAENAVGGTVLGTLTCTNSSPEDKVLADTGEGEKTICIYNSASGNITLYSITVAEAVAAAPTAITIDPSSASVYQNASVTFAANVTGGSPIPTVTWYQCDDAEKTNSVEKGTGSTYIPSTATIGMFYFYAKATNASGSVESDVVTLTVTDPNKYVSGNAYYISVSETPVPGEQIVCTNITMTFAGENDSFNSAVEDGSVSGVNSNYVASVSGKTNKWTTSFAPITNGTLSLGVIINKNKTFAITNVTSFKYKGKNGANENVEATVESNSLTTANEDAAKLYVVVTFDVEAGKTYDVNVAGSKMGFYGFEFTPTFTVSVGAKGFATFCNADYALDFTDKSISAYTIKSTDGNALTLTKVNKIAKNTPVLLYSAISGDSQAIPAIADSETMDDVAGNKLVAGTGAAVTWTESTKFYVLNTTNTPGFYRAQASPVAVGKAYLDLTTLNSNARSFTLNFDDATAIEDANLNANSNSEVYDLQGRRVAQPTKGLYIVNGKKVIVK